MTQPAPTLDQRAESGRARHAGKWMVLAAALLGWMFDGLEMGLFPLVARPSLNELLGKQNEQAVGLWIGVITAGFLVGAATGGVLFGWLGDRIGRVRAMTLSVLTYAVFTGLCSVANSASHVAALRFIAALGMGGEWSLGVALVMEVWPDRSRALMAGLIGAAANLGFLSIAVVGLGLEASLQSIGDLANAVGIPSAWSEKMLANSGWRLLMMVGAAPALLTFFIRLFVPESESWQEEHGRGSTSHWRTRDLIGVVIGACGPIFVIWLWAADFGAVPRIIGTLLGLAVATVGFLYPVARYIGRAEVSATSGNTSEVGHTVGRMLLGAALGGVALLGTWGSIQWAPSWADQLTDGKLPSAKAYTQIYSGLGAVLGTILGAMAGDWFGRRATYTLLCLSSLGAAALLFQGNTEYGAKFLASVFLAGLCTASFYGWLPLYLPELFRTRIRATGQGFSFNFGRILAAIGALQTGNLVQLFEGSYPKACAVTSLIYLVGIPLIWFAPETRGKPLPD